ncbi:hypothetical protein Hanom_Chr06g00479881 [Helianthus anomalus]
MYFCIGLYGMIFFQHIQCTSHSISNTLSATFALFFTEITVHLFALCRCFKPPITLFGNYWSSFHQILVPKHSHLYHSL